MYTDPHLYDTLDEKDERTKRKIDFIQKLLSLESDKGFRNYNVMTRDVYNQLLTDVEEAKSATKKTQRQYRRLKRFDILYIGNTKRLISTGERMRYFLPVEDIFDVIEEAHVAVSHGRRCKMKIETSKEYANITNEMINTFLSTCEVCQQKRNRSRTLFQQIIQK